MWGIEQEGRSHTAIANAYKYGAYLVFDKDSRDCLKSLERDGRLTIVQPYPEYLHLEMVV